MIQVVDMGMIKSEPTGSGMVVENGGYWATSITIQANTGHAAKMVAGKMIDGESMLQSLRELMRDTFGANRVPGTSPRKVKINGAEYQFDEIEMYLYNWLGESSIELNNQEFYRVVPSSQNLFTYRRAVPQQSLWSFSLSLIGERAGLDGLTEYLAAVENDPVNKALTYSRQFSSTWEYLMSIELDETGSKAFGWYDRLNATISEAYYRVAGTLYDIKNSLSLAVMRGQAYANVQYYLYDAMNSFIDDVSDDLGIIPNSYTSSPAKAHYDYSLLREVMQSADEMKRLLPYPDRFGSTDTSGLRYGKHLCKSGETIRTIAEIHKANWKEIASINGIKYPYLVIENQELLIPIIKDRPTTNTIRSYRSLIDDTSSIDELTYGSDIKTDQNGEWVLSDADQDIAVVTGVDSVIQSVESIEKTFERELDDYPWYGNPVLGYLGKTASSGELNVMSTLLSQIIAAHPAIDKIASISLNFSGGVMLFSLSFTLVNNAREIRLQTTVSR